MVYIHGGAFIMGGGASYFFGPNYLLENDVVLVTFNYRYLLKIIKLRVLFFPIFVLKFFTEQLLTYQTEMFMY